MTMVPDQDDQQDTVALADALRESYDAIPENKDTPLAANIAQPPAGAAPIVPPAGAEKPWEAPGWAARWKPEARDALGRFASNPEFKPHFDVLQKQLEEINGYNTRRDQEFSGYRGKLDPVYQVLAPYEQRYALQGMSLQQGVQQLMQSAEFLAQSPDEAFPWLASTYAPSNPAQTLSSLAQAWGVDLNSLDQPYVDPTVSALLNPLQQQVQSLTQQLWQQQAGQSYQQQSALIQEISAFEEAKDANGQLLHPHFRDVFDDMMKAINMGYATNVAGAYEIATQINPQVRASAQSGAAEAARKKALEEAAARTAAAEKAENASRSVIGKGKGKGSNAISLREAFNEAEAQLS
jgi:hypothetical protein